MATRPHVKGGGLKERRGVPEAAPTKSDAVEVVGGLTIS